MYAFRSSNVIKFQCGGIINTTFGSKSTSNSAKWQKSISNEKLIFKLNFFPVVVVIVAFNQHVRTAPSHSHFQLKRLTETATNGVNFEGKKVDDNTLIIETARQNM